MIMKTMTSLKSFLMFAVLIGIGISGQGQATFVNNNSVLTLPAGTSLILSGGVGLKNQNNGKIVNQGEIYVSGDWENSGVADIDDGTVYFNGTTQNVSGNTVFNYINIEYGSNTTINSGAQDVKSILRCDGLLHANGHLTLLSNNTQTALIDGSGIGSVYGTVTQQRYIPASKMKGYKHYSSAFSNATLAQFGNFMNLILGSVTDSPYPTVFKYDETVASPYFGNGWAAAAPKGQTGNPIVPCVGYTVFFGPATGVAKLTYLSGTVNNGNMSIPLYKTNAANASGNGWNLIGNPYPSPIDLWKLPYSVTGINKSVSIYISTSAYYGYYGYYNSASGMVLNGGTRIVGALHGFFVQKKDLGTSTFTFTNAMRTKDLNINLYKEDINVEFPFIKLSAAANMPESIADETAIMFVENGTNGMDADYDASKIMNTDPMIPNFYSTNYNENYAISGLPSEIDETTVVPLGFAVQTSGNYIIKAEDILNIPAGLSVYLEDVATGKIQNLLQFPTYQFTANLGDQSTGRFFLRFSPSSADINASSMESIYQTWANNNILYVSYNNPDGERGKLRIMNILGQEILQEQEISNGMYQYKITQPAGYYLVNFISPSVNKTNRIFIGH